jgi:Ser/Thr protein kinase RdoA (MazF antagonist)
MSSVVALVLAEYPSVLHRAVVTAPAPQAGFSGARVWRLSTPAGDFCLRAGSAREERAHLLRRHALMARARAAGLLFVPGVLASTAGSTVVEHAGRCWEVMDWLPGRPDFQAFPTPARLRAAAVALARLHDAWQRGGVVRGLCPAVTRRLDAARDIPDLHALTGGAIAAGLTPAALRLVARHSADMAPLLYRWQGIPCALQPCLRDVWHDHLLFEDDTLTGLVDYAAVGDDSVAADLARMLGSLVEDDQEQWADALTAYRAVRPLSQEEEQLARVLDRTGTVAGILHWLRWLADPARQEADLPRVAGRLAALLRRVERW